MKKIKIFLGGYVNYPNAQNINCDNIAKYLDKDKFEVHTMYTSKRYIDKENYQKKGIYLHCLWERRFVWYWCKWLTMFAGNFDIYYLPKIESVDRNFAKRFKNKKCFLASVEGVVTAGVNNSEEFKSYYIDDMTDFFSISQCIEKSVEKYWKRSTRILPLGIVPHEHEEVTRVRDKIRNIIWVGNVKKNKRPHYFIKCADKFRNLNFTMVGDGDMQQEIEGLVKESGLNNVYILGRIPNDQVYKKMLDSDLLLMTSEYEGLPKVIQEAAQCSVPSIYIAENYSVDFIKNGENGYAVYSIGEMIDKIDYLVNHPEQYQKMTEMSKEVMHKYKWENIISDYEEFFIHALEKCKR